ncbi:hypothetical protein BCR43DRAFT_498367 [Syncephalastrum racemosum]|uniref:Uncharacterized protein n=1 Tax=Syncephalastrum racemosum TaxID=13706 RepID=A0A1X2H0S7_SYNRA|nr:hypothetical protein BCR43DRAFT_498367 [Syncephalastrum racemosum]
MGPSSLRCSSNKHMILDLFLLLPHEEGPVISGRPIYKVADAPNTNLLVAILSEWSYFYVGIQFKRRARVVRIYLYAYRYFVSVASASNVIIPALE